MVTGESQYSQKGTARTETFFAPAARASQAALAKNIQRVTSNPIADTLLRTVSGMMAILNEERQILALNASLLDSLGIDNAKEALGLRPGEAIECTNAHKHPGGCGTSRHCVTCGAALAMVTALATDKAQEETCALTVSQRGKETDLFFRVRCCPVRFKKKRLLLLFLQDHTIQQQQAALEYVFFHDIQNLISALKLNSQLLNVQEDPVQQDECIKRIAQIARQLEREIETQRSLTTEESHAIHLLVQEVDVSKIINELQAMLSNHPVSLDKTFSLATPIPKIKISSDITLVKRILANMIINAFEATPSGGAIRFRVEQSDKDVSFCVWNNQAIPPEQGLRIFQRNYSTKSSSGRGLGTYSMKLFGETYLGGDVGFVSSKAQGTTFHLSLPKKN
jgi:hypothetical protein